MSVFRKKKDVVEKKDLPVNFSISTASMPVKEDKDGFTAEDIRLIIKEWLDKAHTRFKTRYTKRQVRGITKLQPIADRYFEKDGCLPVLLDEYRIAKLSEDSQTSKELVNILEKRLTGMMMEEKNLVKKGKLGRFFE